MDKPVSGGTGPHPNPPPKGEGIVAAVLLGLVLFYRYTLSYFIGGRCRFTPSCSVYADEALRRYGALKGGGLALRRLCRCHPWGGEGYDPVPDLPVSRRD